MASPDTDELATTPLPAATPADQPDDPATATVPAARQKGTGSGRAGDAAAAVPVRKGAESGRAGDAVSAQSEQTETLPTAGSEAAEAVTVEHERVEPERISATETSAEAADGSAVEVAKDRGRWWRGLTGSLAAGLAVLAAGVLVVGLICLFTGAPGPGAASLIGHPLAAVLALAAQRVADRRRGLPAAGGGLAVVLFAVSAATIFWLA